MSWSFEVGKITPARAADKSTNLQRSTTRVPRSVFASWVERATACHFNEQGARTASDPNPPRQGRTQRNSYGHESTWHAPPAKPCLARPALAESKNRFRAGEETAKGRVGDDKPPGTHKRLQFGGENFECVPKEQRVNVNAALSAYRILWPEFVEEHGCVFLGWHSGSNPPPASDTATGWESFVNHTHILDEFANSATELSGKVVDNDDATVSLAEEVYNEHHPDFLSACELGQRIAKLWALKLARFSERTLPSVLHAIR